MKVQLTGATGFIGANLVRVLLQRGDEVRCLVRKPNLCIEGLDVSLHTVPLLDRRGEIEKLARIMDGCEVVYHLAGIFDPSPGGRDRMYNLHVFGTRSLLRAAEKAGVRRFIHCSSSITVGFGTKENPGDEETEFDPYVVYGVAGPLRDYYSSKLQAEDLVLGWRGIEGIVVNPDFIIGAWDVKPTSGQLIRAMARRPVPFYPLGGKCFLGAEDCAWAHVAAMEKGRVGERYLLGYHNYSYLEFMEIIANVIGKKPPRFPLSNFLMEAAGWLGSRLSRFDAHRFAGLEPNVLRSMMQKRYRSGRKMVDELGIQPQDMEKSVYEAYKWFQEHGYC